MLNGITLFEDLLKSKFTLLILSVLVISCKPNSANHFSLTGRTHGIENGTYLYLHLGDKVDSASVENNRFYFKTKLHHTPIIVTLRSSDWFERRVLWLENSSMNFDASDSNFEDAIVTGSKSENLSQELYKVAESLPRERRLKMEMDFVANNPNSIVSASILSVYCPIWGKEQTKKLFRPFPEDLKSSNYGKKIKRYLQLNKNPRIGERYTDFEMEDQHGKLLKLSDFEGKAVLLEFWSSWCGPCRKENPNLVNAYKKYNPKGFEIVAVSLDEDKTSWMEAIETDGLSWIHLSDLKGQGNTASLIYGITGIPANFLTSNSGVIIGRDLRGEDLNKRLNEFFQ